MQQQSEDRRLGSSLGALKSMHVAFEDYHLCCHDTPSATVQANPMLSPRLLTSRLG